MLALQLLLQVKATHKNNLILHDHYAKAGSRWWVRPKIPTLGEARGKVILMRRFIVEVLNAELATGTLGIGGIIRPRSSINTPTIATMGGESVVGAAQDPDSGRGAWQGYSYASL
jgi:hypothetical protein